MSFLTFSYINVLGFLLFIVFTMVNLALWRIKYNETEHPENIIQIPVWIPVSGAVTSFSFVVFQISQ